MIGLAAIAAIIFCVNVPVGIQSSYAQFLPPQQQQNMTTTTSPAAEPTTTFQSVPDGFQIQVPNGWVVEDTDNTSPSAHDGERTQGVGFLATLCPQDEALPAIGGNYTCTPSGEEYVLIFRYVDLLSRPEFAQVVLEGSSITTSDLFALLTQFDEAAGAQNFRVINDTDMTVNAIDPRTNQTVETAPAKFVEYVYTFQNELGRNVNYKNYYLIALTNNSNTAYVVNPSVPTSGEEPQLSPQMLQILHSFALVTSATSPAPITSTTPMPTPPQQQLEQQPLSSSPLSEQLQLQEEEEEEEQEEETECHPSYPDFCIPPPPPNLNCDDISGRRFTVLSPDPHGLDGRDNDGIGCES